MSRFSFLSWGIVCSLGWAYTATAQTTGVQWQLEASLAPAGAAVGFEFGSAVSLDERRVVVGAPGRNESRGAVYVFVRAAHRWTQEAVLAPSSAVPGDRFGSAVAIDGDYIVAGMPGRNGGAGLAYVYRRGPLGWVVDGEFVGEGVTASDQFGRAVALSGNSAVIGTCCGLGRTNGSAFVFSRILDRWRQEAKLVPQDQNRRFGVAVAIDNRTVLVGGTGADIINAIYVFTRERGGWTVEATIPNQTFVASAWGDTVALSGDIALIGDWGISSFPGRRGTVGVYSRVRTSWNPNPPEEQLPHPTSRNEFGRSVALSGRTAVVSAAGCPIWIFDRSAHVWTQSALFAAGAGSRVCPVATNGLRVLAGEPVGNYVNVYKKTELSQRNDPQPRD